MYGLHCIVISVTLHDECLNHYENVDVTTLWRLFTKVYLAKNKTHTDTANTIHI